MFGNHCGVDAATNVELRRKAHEAGRAALHQIRKDAIGHRFMEGTLLAIGPNVKLKRFELEAALVGHVLNVQGSKVRLSGLRTETREFGNPDANRIIPLRRRIVEDFELLRGCGGHRS